MRHASPRLTSFCIITLQISWCRRDPKIRECLKDIHFFWCRNGNIKRFLMRILTILSSQSQPIANKKPPNSFELSGF